ncbi:bifunctional folylpolyglutamate synthase/dihydrofolate synthase [Egicoccus halophilus]|uniref:bifunctional folylpolyglutamate synthase/dihydrofolate synthase n=1 Tax=Egicoccus halophilus TaxID=1670830 RepID=UPI001031C189|nr:Mur ligase family protein [Egicoccus halophilus]
MSSALSARMAAHFERRRHGQRPGRRRLRVLAGMLGDPQDRYRCLHVTGTNGKTTVTRLASAVLSANGLRVGAFTSPHLEDVRERIAVDGEPVTEATFLAALDRVEAAVARAERHLGERITFFELMTATASVLFADAGVDVAAVEVGIGGRLDPTNVHHGEVAVIASIGLDHPELGSTTAEVAGEKAGILEPVRPPSSARWTPPPPPSSPTVPRRRGPGCWPTASTSRSSRAGTTSTGRTSSCGSGAPRTGHDSRCVALTRRSTPPWRWPPSTPCSARHGRSTSPRRREPWRRRRSPAARNA